ncbi:MAG: methylmalonyl-CoA mutase [Deltaproteobacteria bacterium]|jgi:methylmalonyl-CoA mutase N-terminal domain/subunit|nr:methylmalonyl-CoA mutase [Deltaproteobacteria bacterium]
MSDSESIRPSGHPLEEAIARWERETLAPRLAEAPERKENFRTQAMKWEVNRLYTPRDLDAIDFDFDRDVGFPGEFPYTRGTDPNGYRSDLWNMVQVSGFGTGEDWSERAQFMLDQGLDGLIIEYDLPTTNGFDSDHALAIGEVGRAGVAIDSLADMERALDFDLANLSYLTSVCNGPQPVNLAMIIAALERKGVDPSSFTLQMPNAILIEYTCVGRYIYPPGHGLRIATDVIEYVIRNYPNWIPVSVVSAQIYAARANPVQELAFGFSIAMQYIDSVLERGFTIDEVAPYFSFVTGVDQDFFEAIGKLRAYRKVWARLMRDRYGATRDAALKLRLMSSPGTMSLTLQQPLNNIARLSTQMLSCVLGGGAQTMTNPLHDEAHALPSEEAIAVGAAIQNIVAHETGAADTIDPLAGSYYIESMTRRIEDAVMAEIEKIDALGGALEAIKNGYFQRELAREQSERNREIEDGTRKLIGVNHLVREGEERQIELFALDPESETRQVERLRKLRAERDATKVEGALERVRDAAESGENLMPSVLEAVKVSVTGGEICDVLRESFGVYSPDSLTTGV